MQRAQRQLGKPNVDMASPRPTWQSKGQHGKPDISPTSTLQTQCQCSKPKDDVTSDNDNVASPLSMQQPFNSACMVHSHFVSPLMTRTEKHPTLSCFRWFEFSPSPVPYLIVAW